MLSLFLLASALLLHSLASAVDTIAQHRALALKKERAAKLLPTLEAQLADLKARKEFAAHDTAPDNLAVAKARKLAVEIDRLKATLDGLDTESDRRLDARNLHETPSAAALAADRYRAELARLEQATDEAEDVDHVLKSRKLSDGAVASADQAEHARDLLEKRAARRDALAAKLRALEAEL